MRIRRFLVALCFVVVNAGCVNTSMQSGNGEPINSVHDVSSYVSVNVTLSVEEAGVILFQLMGEDIPESHFEYIDIDYTDGFQYYIFKGFNDFPDHRVTFGWYAVDIHSGDVYDTNVLTDMIPIS